MIPAIVAVVAIPVFAQLSLTDAKRLATENSVDVQMATATVRQREATLDLVRGTAIPHIIGDYALAPQANAANTGTVEQHYFAVGAGVSINDLITSSSSVRAAAAELLAAQRSADAAGLAARENAVRLYFAALQAIAIEGLRGENLRGAVRDRSAAGLRARSGESPQLDVVRADVTLAQANADLVRARSARADAIDALASATAVNPELLTTLTRAAVMTRPPADIALSVKRALAMRPELAALLATLKARNADVASASRSAIPTATIQGGYQSGVDTGIPVRGAQVAAHLDIPLSSGSGARVSSAEAQVTIAYAQLVDERRRITLEVAAAVRDAAAQEVAASAAETAHDEARRALESVEIGYREGASSSLDLAEARRLYAQAAVDSLVAEYQSATALAIVDVIVP
ncbi:MAG TPA: TolC family protein [Candidatus Nitrosotalea sp.]|nr:TolC family protein [Candidatus Nitrosotalea sp.]